MRLLIILSAILPLGSAFLGRRNETAIRLITTEIRDIITNLTRYIHNDANKTDPFGEAILKKIDMLTKTQVTVIRDDLKENYGEILKKVNNKHQVAEDLRDCKSAMIDDMERMTKMVLNYLFNTSNYGDWFDDELKEQIKNETLVNLHKVTEKMNVEELKEYRVWFIEAHCFNTHAHVISIRPSAVRRRCSPTAVAPHATRLRRQASINRRTRHPTPTCSRMMSLDGLDKSQIHMDDWPHSHNDIVVHQQPIPHHCTPAIVTDEVRFSIIQAISHRPGIWDSQREKTSGASRKELFVQVTNEVNNQHALEQPLSPEEVEKQWKNLKDTFIKTRKKVSYNSDGTIVQPKWKFYMHLTFLDSLSRGGKRSGSRYDEDELLPPNLIQMKRFKEDDPDEDDEYMGFCRSLLYPLREIGFKDRVTLVKLQKSIRDLVHEAQMTTLLGGQMR